MSGELVDNAALPAGGSVKGFDLEVRVWKRVRLETCLMSAVIR